MKRLHSLLAGALLLSAISLTATAQTPSASASAPETDYYLSTSFHEPADEGLRLLYSTDGIRWDSIPGTWLAPKLGAGILRAPSIRRGPDGTFHLVWTIAWKGDTGIGYASSKDLIHWSEQRRLPVMDHVADTYSVWAPELFYDEVKGQFLIVYTAVVNDGTCTGRRNEHGDYHRLYYVTTRDFTEFSSPRLLYDAGYSCIDGFIVKRGEGDYVLVAKDNRKANSNLRVAFARHAEGPYTNPLSRPFTGIFAEGPSVSRVGDTYYIYYDLYRRHIYGASTTRDFIHFTDVTDQVSFPQGHKHGTTFRAPASIVEGLLRAAQQHGD